jgi:hypothetical protein
MKPAGDKNSKMDASSVRENRGITDYAQLHSLKPKTKERKARY